jgi:hypothetical protein
MLIRRIRWLSDSYDLQWILDQEVRGEGSLSLLPMAQVEHVLAVMERAHACIVEGIGFDEAGLVKPLLVDSR